jgi:peptidoglycan/xylan/chitin deacetylase (PgdA/CDA1 family)
MRASPADLLQSAKWKSALIVGLYKTGALHALHGLTQYCEVANDHRGRFRLQRVHKGKYLILAYHRIGTKGAPLFSALPQAVFAEQMRFIKQHYRILSVKQLVQELQDPYAQGQAVAITFDDGYLGTLTEAFPVLEAYQIPATVYLTGEAVETGELAWYDKIFLQFQRAKTTLTLETDGPTSFNLHNHEARLQAAEVVITHLRTVGDNERQKWCARFDKLIPLDTHAVRGAMLTWDDVRTMHSAGITFGAHTMTHPVVSRLSAERLRQEIAGSQSLIEERLNEKVDEFAFPFGKWPDCGTAAEELLKQLEFVTALTAEVGINRPGDNLYRLRRVAVDNSRSIARFALTLHKLFFVSGDEDASANWNCIEG